MKYKNISKIAPSPIHFFQMRQGEGEGRENIIIHFHNHTSKIPRKPTFPSFKSATDTKWRWQLRSQIIHNHEYAFTPIVSNEGEGEIIIITVLCEELQKVGKEEQKKDLHVKKVCACLHYHQVEIYLMITGIGACKYRRRCVLFAIFLYYAGSTHKPL